MGPTPLSAPISYLLVPIPTTSSFSCTTSSQLPNLGLVQKSCSYLSTPTHRTDGETQVQSSGSELSEVSKSTRYGLHTLLWINLGIEALSVRLFP